MYISSIEVNNFRRYLGTSRLTLSPQPGRNIAVISGANGYGKTSILLAVLWCLYGARLQWLDDGYRRLIRAAGDYDSFCRGMLNRVAGQSGQEEMYVELTFSDVLLAGVAVDCVVLRRSFNVSQSCESVRLAMGQTGAQMVSPESIDAFIEDSLIPLELAPYLLFDAERLAAGEGVWGMDTKQLSSALSVVAGLRPLEQLRDDLRSVRMRIRRDSAKRPQRAAMDALEQHVRSANSQLESLSDSISLCKDERLSTLREIDRVRKELARSGSVPTQASLAELERRKQTLENEGEEIRSGLRTVLEVAPLAIAGGILRRLERELTVDVQASRAWSEDEIRAIADSTVAEVRVSSALGLSDTAAEKLRASLFKILSNHSGRRSATRKLGRVQILRDFSGDDRTQLRDVLASLRGGFGSRLSMSLRAFRLNRREYARVVRALTEASRLASDPDIELAQRQLSTLEARATELDDDLQRMNREYGGLRSGIEDLDRQSASMAERITVSERHQKVDAIATELVDELDAFVNASRQSAAEALRDRLEHAFAGLLHKKGLIASASVSIDTRDVTVTLADVRGERVLTETLSRGEQQLCSMAVLMALLGMAPEPFPLFLDSPFQRLDEKHVANLVSGLLALAETQVVLFPLPGTELSPEVSASLSAVTSDAYVIQDQGEWSAITKIVPEAAAAR
jgi:DNA sulfur modification protein DndD